MSESQATTLNVTDIVDAVKIIDYAAEQGAFRGWQNIRQIMIVRDRLEAFVAAANVHVNPSPLNTSAAALD
jgi:hypothetical protein